MNKFGNILLLLIQSSSLVQRALQAYLYCNIRNQPVFLKTSDVKGEAVLSQSIGRGKKKGGVRPETGFTILELEPSAFWVRIVCTQLAWSAGTMNIYLSKTPHTQAICF